MLSLTNVVFSYDKSKILNNISFSVEKGKHISLIGESGSGKSTLLKVIYGLEDLDEGKIFWNDAEVLGPKYNLVPGMSFMKYLAQDFDLMPFTTAAENIGKFLSNFYLEEKQKKVEELLDLVEMTEFSNVKVKNLSGGQMQRVAIARVLALEPEILLFDEPFSHIDNSRKNNLRRSVFNYAKEKGITCIVATHDMDDALSFSDEIIVLKNGEIIASEKPKELFSKKNNLEIAKLFGDVNQISKKYFELDSFEDILVYPFELVVVEKSKLEVNVIKSYYKGQKYLVEAKYKEGVLYFESLVSLKPGVTLYLTLLKLSN
ncbi:ABC transporter ATP-binding protein [Flavobacterium sp. N2270]|uniref:ABC transporter ATP-binding protein n=1 Tax=Flavobacterium sp. N2270 TaxID=2986831 RepID=UPI0022251A19|nr:ABC transporter ATP-binding protein [Flavobacterium sp. N2270]